MNSLTSRVARIVAVAIVAVLALSTLTFLGTDEARAETVEATSTGDSIVKVGWMDDVYDWNPLRVTMVADHVVYRLVYSSLFSYDEDIQRPVNDLAMGYTIVVNPDGTMTVTIPITHNAYFRNAANPTDTSWPLTADDVVYTFNLILANPGYTWGFNLEGCMGFTAVDDYTVAVDVAYEKSTIIDDLTDIPILCRYYWSTLSNPFGTISPEDNFGSGPFYFDAMLDGAWYRFNTAPNYHGAEDYPEVRDVDIDGLLYTVFTDMNALTIAMNEGAVDTISLLGDINTFTDVLGVGSTVPVTKMAVQEPGICDVAINAVPECFDTPTYCDGNPILRDPAVRKAIMMCLDKDYIVNDMLFGLPTMADSVIQPGFWHYTPDNQLPFDPVAARQVLIDAGYGYDSDGDGMLEAGPDSLAVIEGWCAEGTELSGIRCEAPDTDPTYYWVALAWTNWAQDAGIGLMPAMLSEGVMTNIAWYKCDYDIWVWHWGWDPDPIGSALSCWMISEIEEGGDNCQMPMGDWWYNDYNYTDAFEEIGLELDGRWSEYDEVLSQALRTVDTDDRKLLVNHLQQMIYDSYTENPPYYDFGLYAYTDVRFSGWGDWAAHPGLAIRSTMPWLWFNLESDGNAAPYFASALASSYQVIAGDESPFSVVVSDREGDPLTVEWLWGDGTTSVDYLATSTDVPTAVEQSHVYSTIGTFMLTVNLYDLEHVVSCYATVSSLDHLNTAPTILSLEAVTPLPWLANQDIAFSGIAVDSESGGEDGPGLIFTWDWDDGTYTVEQFQPIENDVEVFSYPTHAWTYPGYYTVTLSVDDCEGITVSADYLILIEDGPPGRQAEYNWHGMFQPPLGDWFDKRWEVYGNYEPLDDSGVNMYRVYYPSGNSRTFSMMWLDSSAYNMSEINMDSNPQFLPYLGTERGGHASMDWYMSYLDSENLTMRYPAVVAQLDDGWLVGLNGDIYLDQQAAKAVLGVDDAGLTDFDSWWAANSDAVEAAYAEWLDYEANERLDIFNMYEYPFTMLYFELTAETYYDYIVVHIDSVTWGMECLMASWLNEAYMPTEWMFDSMYMGAGIGPDEASVTVYATVENAVYASEVPWVGTPCWVWQGMLGDYIPSTLAHPDSDFDPYVGLDYQCRDPGSYLYGGMMPFDHTPGSFDLGAGDTMTFEWPAGDQMFLQHQAYGYTLETFGEMEAVYSEPAVTDMPGQVAVDESSRTVTFTGPIDFEEWSVTQTAHDYLESEWDRLGILPYGMPYMQFSQASDSGDVIYDCVLLEQFDSWETLDANWTITNNTNGLFENWFDVVDGNLVASDNGLLVYSDYTSYANWTGLVRYDDRLWVSFDIYLPMDYNVKDGWAGQVFYVGLLDENGDFGLLTRFVMDTSTYPNGFVYWSADGTIKQICPFTAGWHSVDIWMDKGETTWTAIFDSIAYPGLTYSQPGTSPFDLSEVTFMNALREEPDTILVNSLGITRVTSTAGELSDPPSVWADVYPYAGSSYDPFYLYAYCYDDETPVDQLMVRWDWEGDGLWDTGWTAEKFAYHFYPYSGVFHPTVQVMDEDGQTGEWSDYVIVDNAPPVAVAGGDVTVPQYSMVTLDATASYDDVGIAAYLWEVYGTWYTWSDQPVMEAWFDTPGTYTAVLTVWDLAWHSGTDYVTITVEPVHVVTVTSDQKSENVITYIYTPESDGAWIAKVHNDGLKWLLVEVYELGPNDKLVGKDMLSFKNMGAYPDGTVLSDMFMLKADTSYLVKLTPSGEIGTFATVMDVFISLGSYAAAEEEVVSARTWSDG